MTGLVDLRHAGLAEILRNHDVGGDLRPLGGDLGIGHLEDDRPSGLVMREVRSTTQRRRRRRRSQRRTAVELSIRSRCLVRLPSSSSALATEFAEKEPDRAGPCRWSLAFGECLAAERPSRGYISRPCGLCSTTITLTRLVQKHNMCHEVMNSALHSSQ